MSILQLLLLTAFASVSMVESCDMNFTIVAKTAKPVFFQIKSFDGSTSKLYHLEKNEQEQKLRLKGKVCGMHTTEVSTFKDVNGEKGTLVHNTLSILEGNGAITYWVTDDLWPRMVTRMGIFCAIECGGRG